MSTTQVCPCDAANPAPITNLPNLSLISYRAGDFNSFRRALLTPLLAPPGDPPLEQSLTAWQSGAGADPSIVDLGVMMVEWWAYLCDILTFYNERIANEDYLRTAVLPETPGELIQLLGYRPRPAIGAAGTLAALVTPSVLPGQTVTLPQGLQFQSKPGPNSAPQTFELSSATQIGVPDQVPAITPPNLVAALESYFNYRSYKVGLEIKEDYLYKKITNHELDGSTDTGVAIGETTSYAVLLQGTVTSLTNGMSLLLGPRDETTAAGAPTLITLSAPPAVQTISGGTKQTVITFTADPAPPPMTAENARLMKANQTASLWSFTGASFTGSAGVIELAQLVRQIRPNDYIAFTAPSADPILAQVQSTTDILGDASSAGTPTSVSTGTPTTPPVPIPVLHTQLTLTSATATAVNTWLSGTAAASVTILFGWVEVGTLVDQPPVAWDGVSSNLQAIQPAQFPAGSSLPVFMQDSIGNGQQATGTVDSSGDLDVSWPTSTLTPLSTELQPPITVYYNLLPVTRGKTVANEILGSGNATISGQSFMLAKSPVTYLTTGSSYASTIVLTVNGIPWTEVASFYGQPANAQIFITREDSNQNTWVYFGDGVNGALLPTGTNNVVATYRIGGGAASPPAGKLTVIAQSYPGLKSVVNPVAVSGGSDPDPASLLKEYAPRSVLTFGRAVSVFDYQALAAQAPGVTMAAATWSWDPVNLRASVTVYVAGELNVASSVQTLLSAAGDPNRPVTVLTATPVTVTLTMALVVTAGMDAIAIQTAVQTALCDPNVGLFSPANLGIGQGLFDSEIEVTVLAVAGVVAIQSNIKFTINGSVSAGPLHTPGEGAYFSLAPSGFYPSTEVAAND
jgi:hypothetical protein